MKYTILIENLEVKAIIGILEEERVNPQKIIINSKITYLKKDNFLDYAKVCKIIEELLIKRKFLLLEDAIEEIIKEIKSYYPSILSIYLQIKKTQILKNALVGVEILRNF